MTAVPEPPGPQVTPLTNSTTSLPKATYVPLIPKATQSDISGAAMSKVAFARNLGLQPGETAAVQAALAVTIAPSDVDQRASDLYPLLQAYEGSPLPAQLPLPSSFTDVAVDDLVTFGNALSSIRQKALSALAAGTDAAGTAANLVNTALVATKTLRDSAGLPPIGMLNLENLEMTPAGIQRGGLLATIPLAPQERTSVVQQEWSVTSQEFTSIVTDSLENYSQTGVTENTQLTQATTSQVSHSNQFNVTASASGGIGFVSGSAATSFGSQDQNSQSATDSRTDSVQTTKQASSRVTQSHKMSISTSLTTGTSETSTRVLYNPSSTEAMRVDYYSIMRQWYVALYRYGLRLTYDITVPAPGGTLRETYMQITKLQKKVAEGFTFPITYQQINNDPTSPNYYQTLAAKYGAQVSPPPGPAPMYTLGGVVPNLSDKDTGWKFWPVPVNIDSNYWITNIWIGGIIGPTDNNPTMQFKVLGSNYSVSSQTLSYSPGGDLASAGYGNFLLNATGSQTIQCFFQYVAQANITFTVYTELTPSATATWQAEVWSALYNAAQNTFYQEQQALTAQIQELQDMLAGVDTLTLRREEHDEIMKAVLRWLLGDTSDVFMPANVNKIFKSDPDSHLKYGVEFTGASTSLSPNGWSMVDNYEQQVNFINQAIDWDNLVYFLYSYFWDVPQSWDYIRQIQHPDSTRQAFLRAGSARIVLTVQPGWELAWTYFLLTGSTVLPSDLPQHPYLTIAQQIADYDATSYPGIPPADPNNTDPMDYDNIPPIGTTATGESLPTGDPNNTAVSIPVVSSDGFLVGATAIIDTGVDASGDWVTGIQEAQTITAIPDGTHITVAALANSHTTVPFPVVQAGSKGVLIAEWFEYTPTSGTDIVVNSDLSTVA